MNAKKNRRWYQFSLRTLLASVTVAGVGLGLTMAYVAPAERQRGIVRQVEGLGGRVVYYEPSGSEWWGISQLRHWLARDYFDRIEVVDLHGHPATDSELRSLSKLAHLRLLLLDDTAVTDSGLAYVQDLKRLRCIWLRKTGVTHQGVTHLQAALPACEIIDEHFPTYRHPPPRQNRQSPGASPKAPAPMDRAQQEVLDALRTELAKEAREKYGVP